MLSFLKIKFPTAEPEFPRLMEFAPVRERVVPVAFPNIGEIKVGLLSITKVLPVPVWEATAVVLPVEVMGPFKFALVVTVAAFPLILVWSPVLVPERVASSERVRVFEEVPPLKEKPLAKEVNVSPLYVFPVRALVM